MLVIRDGQPAEDGEAAGGIQERRLGVTLTAQAALVALLVRQGVRVAEGALCCGLEKGGWLRQWRGHQAWAKHTGRLLAGVGEGTALPLCRQFEHGWRRDRGGATQRAAAAGEAGKAEAVLQPRTRRLVESRKGGGPTALFSIVDEVAARTIWTETDGVEGAAQLSLVLRMAAQTTQLLHAMGKLAFIAIFAGAVLLKRPAQLRLVTARVDLAASSQTRLRDRTQPVPQLRVGALAETILLVAAVQQNGGICDRRTGQAG